MTGYDWLITVTVAIPKLVNAVKHKKLTSSDRKLVYRKAEGFGLSQIIIMLDIFLDTSSQKSENDEFYIKIYDSVHLENGQILRTTREF
ncbi:hypothetical protein C1646_776043 [Rhizophagus diaphanus]|nr:hypothetical protein C1646_776043 [Rhizophagus diaphanus] [Rhizophagus sp. MUCL 43196]